MGQEPQANQPDTPRVRLTRRAAVLQIKLLADGLRDAILIPVSLIAAVIGLIRGGDNAEAEFQQVIKLGRRSERWINLFGHHRPLAKSHPAGSIDALIGRAEAVLREQVRKGRASAQASAEVEAVLDELHQFAGKDGSVEK